jgi:hypothetical protein
MSLAAPANAGTSVLAVNNNDPSGTFLHGIYAGTQLVVKDNTGNGLVETVVAVTAPQDNIIELASPLQFGHTPPPAPDSLWVSALPWAVEQATIDITSVLIKTQGARAFTLPSSSASISQRRAMSMAGCSDEFDRACHMLKSFKLPFIR